MTAWPWTTPRSPSWVAARPTALADHAGRGRDRRAARVTRWCGPSRRPRRCSSASASSRRPCRGWPRSERPGGQGTPTEVVERIFADEWTRPARRAVGRPARRRELPRLPQPRHRGPRRHARRAGATRISDAPPLWTLHHPARRIVVVAHAGTNATALGHLLGIPPVPWEWERFVSFHASVSVVRPLEISGGHSFSLFRFSDVDHLRARAAALAEDGLGRQPIGSPRTAHRGNHEWPVPSSTSS